MNQEQRNAIEILSIRHFTEFGTAPDGRLRFRWMRTDEMPIEFSRGFEMKKAETDVLWTPNRVYKKRTVADTYGQGLCWTLAYLEPPVSQEAWEAEHGSSIPWPSNGYYRPIDNIVLHIEKLPDADISARAAFNIRHHLEFTFKDWVEIEEKARIKRDTAYRNEVSDMVEDATPAFGNDPGGKGSTSFPAHQ